MDRWSRCLIALLIAMLLVSTPTPVQAAGTTAQQLPPIPEWPIIGPLLQWLGLAPETTPEPTPTPTPTPTLPEYRVKTLADLEALEPQLRAGEKLRLIIAELDLNAALAAAVAENPDSGLRNLHAVLEQDRGRLTVEVDRALLEEQGIPLGGRESVVRIAGTFGLTAADCGLELEIQKVQVNDRDFPLGKTAQGIINRALAENWPKELCLERVQLTPGQLAVEGYRR